MYSFSKCVFLSAFCVVLFLSHYNIILMTDVVFHNPCLAGIPGCAKSALCRELLNASSAYGDGRLVQSLMGDLTKGMIF